MEKPDSTALWLVEQIPTKLKKYAENWP